jgi:hypothetical protein
MFLKSQYARIDFILQHVLKHTQPLESLEALYRAPTNSQNRECIELLESRLNLPVRSCFIGYYRVGFGNIEDFLREDPGLRDRAYEAERAGTSIAHLPAWDFPGQNNDGLIHAPPAGWQPLLAETAALQPAAVPAS